MKRLNEQICMILSSAIGLMQTGGGSLPESEADVSAANVIQHFE